MNFAVRNLNGCGALASRSMSTAAKRNVVLVDGVRIPFTMAGSVYGDLIAVDLARLALKGLLVKTAIDPASIDFLNYGTGKQ